MAWGQEPSWRSETAFRAAALYLGSIWLAPWGWPWPWGQCWGIYSCIRVKADQRLTCQAPRHTGTSDQIFIQALFLRSWGCHRCQKKQKTSKNLNLLVWCAVFQPDLKKHQKTIKPIEKRSFFGMFLKFPQSWVKNSAPNPKIQLYWSFSLLLTPITPQELKNSGEILFICLFLRFWDSGAT